MQHSADVTQISNRLPTDPALLTVAAELLRHAVEVEEVRGLARGAFAFWMPGRGIDRVVIAFPQAGQWSVATQWADGKDARRLEDEGERLPVELFAEVIDSEEPRCASRWVVAPLAPHTSENGVLAFRLADESSSAVALAAVRQLAPIVHQAVAAIQHRAADRRRLLRLKAILEIVGKWNQTRELEPLLMQMAEAATQWLQADRASIFLWDRPNHLLVGRPALGLPHGELRIADDRGVVGEVIQTGETRRVDAIVEPQAIDRKIDAQLHYQTRTVLCVPLHGRSGERLGAFELINKKDGVFSQEDETALVELASHASVALENAQDRKQLITANRQIIDQAAEKVRMIGESPAVEALRSIVRRVADTELAVLILGENGTGKEVVAQSIHYWSRRRNRPFIAVNCAAIPETLAESELFGHEKGAFTDARDARPGKFELAAGGTLFLDEIGDLSLGSQAKLLRVLEERVLVRVGGSTPIHTDARLLAATNQNLAELVRAKRFREDLYFRLNVVTLDLPPLRERGDDVLLLAEYFLNDFCQRAHRKTPELTAAARKRLAEHSWPGNIRELRNLMERLAYLSTSDRIEAEDLAFILSPRGQTPTAVNFNEPLAEATDHFQIEFIRHRIEQCNGNMSLAAERLGLHRSNLYRKMRQLGMETT
jgi:Nif-specific regulatory protein